jgi:acyl carrier protein
MAIEILGRVDDQIKVRGFRVEPGEVEGALLAHPSVHSAAALLHESDAGVKHLVAYCVSSDAELDATAIRAFAARRLPDYMVPAAVSLLAALPLTPSGKLDRGALPTPAFGAESKVAHAPPQTDAERGVVEIWSELLGLERIGLDDRFADLGGHSLTMMRVASRLERDYGARVSLADLLASDTPRALADLLEATLVAEMEAMSDEEVAAALAKTGERG